MILVVAEGEEEALRIVNGLCTAADVEQERDPLLAKRYRKLADAISDGLEVVTREREAGP